VGDKVSIAALAISALAFAVVLVSPAPRAPAESAGTRSEGIVSRGQAETNALDEDAKEFERLKARADILISMRENSGPDMDKTAKLMAEAINREIKRQLPAFQNQLRIIRLYEKKEPDKKPAEKKTEEQPAREKAAEITAVEGAREKAEATTAVKAADEETEEANTAAEQAVQDKAEGGED